MKITPTCKYGHGELFVEKRAEKEDVWVALSVDDGLVNIHRGFTFSIYKCKDCTYIELHDAEVDL